jgi:hypothetical protein
MRNADDIRRVLLAHEDRAPEATGLVEAARAGAVRVRRRRRLVGVATVAVVALVVPVTVVAGLRGADGEPAAVTPSPTPSQWPHVRDPSQVTVDVDPAGGYTVLERQAQRDRQVVRLRPPGSPHDVVVTVHEPGTFDPAPFLRGEEENTAGRRLHYLSTHVSEEACPTVPPQPRDGVTPEGCLSVNVPGQPGHREPRATPALAWAEPSGAWVVMRMVTGSNRVDLRRAAGTIRMGPPRDLRTPYRLGYLPPGFTAVYAAAKESPPRPVVSTLALDPNPAVPVTGPDPTTVGGRVTSVALTISVTPMTNEVARRIADLGTPTKVAGLDTFYLAGPTAGWGVEPGAAVFVASDGTCPVFMNIRERDRIPRPELERIVGNATFTDCANPATWTAPLR